MADGDESNCFNFSLSLYITTIDSLSFNAKRTENFHWKTNSNYRFTFFVKLIVTDTKIPLEKKKKEALENNKKRKKVWKKKERERKKKSRWFKQKTIFSER